jgi:NAD+ diphosphatase
MSGQGRFVIRLEMRIDFVPGIDAPGGAVSAEAADTAATPAVWFVLRKGDLLVQTDGDSVSLPFAPDLGSLGFSPSKSLFIGTLDGHPCRCAEIAGKDPTRPAAARSAAGGLPDGWVFKGLRALFSAAGEELFRIAGRATQIADWDRSHRFCGACGTPTLDKSGERAKECPSCGLLFYPRISPAVIVAVVRDGRILLAHAARFSPRFHSVLAGFLDVGETLEECVHREVMEEVGIRIGELSYFTSQPWPFPNSLMVAYTARHVSGEIAIDGREIDEADWYSPGQIPKLIPGKMSVARKLIDWFVSEYGESGPGGDPNAAAPSPGAAGAPGDGSR